MDEIKFYLSDDSNNMLANYKNGTWLLIDDVPTSEIANLKVEYPNEFVIAGMLGTYYVNFNINKNLLPADTALTGVELEKANAEVRQALGLLFDRNYVVNDIAQGGQTPASSFVAMGLTDADGSSEFYQNAGHNEGFAGYYNVAEDAYEGNFEAAMEILKKYYTYDETTGQFTNFPTMEYLYNTSEGHKAIAEYLQSVFAGVGIGMNLTNQEWATFLNTRKDGDYEVARNGWIGDYNDPISFLDMWTSGSGNNDVQFGKDAHAEVAMYNLDLTPFGLDTKVENGTWAETYDVLISAVKANTDIETRFAMMHLAEDMLMETGCLIPVYYYTDLYMINEKVQGFYSIPLGYKYFMYTTLAD
jgi:oligopeptide transport system substrate-binding protein